MLKSLAFLISWYDISVNFICSSLSAAEAELLYIREVERLDGFGQESFPVKVRS